MAALPVTVSTVVSGNIKIAGTSFDLYAEKNDGEEYFTLIDKKTNVPQRIMVTADTNGTTTEKTAELKQLFTQGVDAFSSLDAATVSM